MRNLLLTLCLLSHVLSHAQLKSLTAVKAANKPVIDGDLNEAVWQSAPVATDFIQNFPNYGNAASVRSEVRILYDNDAIYIGAYLFDDPALIRKQLTPRDGEQRQDVDYFSVFFDTYNDQQNGFQFLVTSANVQTDARLGGSGGADFGDFGDKTWDAVWQSNVQQKNNGWTIEMRIPYISLRFSKKEIQTWGLQFLRFTRRNNESSYWNRVDPNINGFVNQFGKYENLKDIQPPLRLSFSPYISSGIRINPEGSDIKRQWLRNGGMDVKYGVNESFTLDATLIPDFGQVVSDNIINNLSAFELQFKENRPFFTEGTELFNKAQLFYSRRIGAIPSGYYRVQSFASTALDFDLIKNPSVTQLYNGIKFSGRTKKKLGIGVFNALTAPMKAKLRNLTNDRDTLIETEPLANYNIIVLDQALKGRSSVTFTNTNVHRKGESRDANVSAFDWSLFTNDNKFSLKGTARYSKIFGFTPYSGNINLIYDTVSRNGKLYVKPYSGYNTSIQFGKVSGKVQYGVTNEITSHTYDPNDLGYLQFPNKVNYEGAISYNQLTSTDQFITYRYALNVSSFYLYKPYRFSEVNIDASAFWVFKNFWDVTLDLNSYPTWQNDYFDLRTPGKYLKRPPEMTFSVEGSSDSRKRWYFSYDAAFAVRKASNNGYNQFEFGLRYRFSDKFTLSTSVFRQYEQNQRGFSFQRELNGEPIAGFRNYTDFQTILSGIYNFTPRMNFTLRTRHYWNKVKYTSFYNIDNKGTLTSRPFINGVDENYNVFNVDAFFTWDYRLGSRLIFGWKNWIDDYYGVDLKYKRYSQNLQRTLDLSHGNELTLKLIYFLDYNQLRKKK
jgi:hypothetical protein